jgi:hypothetical protein
MLINQCRAIDSAPAKDARRMPQSESIEKPSIAEHPIAVFSNTYARLPEHFFARLSPTPVAGPHLIKFNELLAEDLGLVTRGLGADALAGIFGGNVIPLGAEPIAMAYAAHQFGNFVPQLGDGRAILVGEVVDRNGERRDIQLKGAAERRSPVAAMAALHWGRSYANISLAKRCMRSESLPRGRWRPSQQANVFSATARCLGPC